MKIGLLTFHYVSNLGSVLQSYCGYRLIQELFPGEQVELINLVPLKREFHNYIIFSKRWPFIRLDRLKRLYDFRRFLKTQLVQSKRCYKTKLIDQISYINDLKYDLVFTGSDTVWMRSEKLYNQLPSIYFLPNVHARKVALAVSADPVLDAEQYTKKKNELYNILEDYTLVSVRDSSTAKILQEIGFERYLMIADPVLLYPFEKELISVRFNNRPVLPIKRIAIALIDHNLALTLAAILRKSGFHVSLLYDKVNVFRNILYDEISDCAKYDAIITDRFHFCIIALKLSSSLVLNIEIRSRHPYANSKGRDLFHRLKLEQYFWSHEDSKFDDTEKFILKSIFSWNESDFLERDLKVTQFIESNRAAWFNFKNIISETAF